jgi:peptide chain release factor subunit 1
MPTTISLDALRELAGFRADSRCAISLYLDLDPSRSPTAVDVATRVRSLLSEGEKRMRSDLAARARDGVRGDLERLERFFDGEFDRDGATGFAVFTAGPKGMWHTLPLAGAVTDSITIDREFHLAPLVPLVGHGAGALVVFVSRERGSLYRLHDGRLLELADLTDEAPTRHDQGGWSQSRYERHIDTLAEQHYRAVASELERRFRRLGRPRIVVVCTDDVRPEFSEALSHEVAEAVIGWTQAEAHAAAAQVREAVSPVLARWRADRERQELERWQEEVGRAARASAGWAETLEAASDARVELLLYRDGVDHEAVRCPRCGRVQAEGDVCPLDGEPFERSAKGLDLAVRQTLANGGSVWAVRDSRDLDPAGGIGAILRF